MKTTIIIENKILISLKLKVNHNQSKENLIIKYKIKEKKTKQI
jgi:hypothetical protein